MSAAVVDEGSPRADIIDTRLIGMEFLLWLEHRL
jgi:hypothetical protein